MVNQIKELKKLVKNSEILVAFTGAGFSAESGIPTYRGAGGLWSKYDPSVYADINYFLNDPSYYWRFFKNERYPVIKKARPNVGHFVLAELQKRGRLYKVITQNIDGLHQIAGVSDVIELHGTTRSFRCMTCDKQFTMDEAYKKIEVEIPPKCDCGGLLRPNTVMFGEPIPQDALNEAINAAQHCDLFFVLGSSLSVTPAAQLPVIAKESNAKLVIVNIDKTPLDHLADLVIHQSTSTVLQKII